MTFMTCMTYMTFKGIFSMIQVLCRIYNECALNYLFYFFQ